MKNIITISTVDYISNTQRLLISLNKTNKDFCLTIFCEAYENFTHLQKIGNCNVRELPSIKTFGVKRAKFEAYCLSLLDGDFLYLDSDIIVLDDISSLFGGAVIKGVLDDLSACPFIIDKQYPWRLDADLKNDVYINSGVFFAPKKEEDFFLRLLEHSLSDEIWNRFVIEGKLNDNHFFCAFLNIMSKKVEAIDQDIYNWQGFYKDKELVVFRAGNTLLNRANQKRLKIIHFAGIPDIDGFLTRIPVDISSLIFSYCIDNDFIFSENKLFAFLAEQNTNFIKEIDDTFVIKVFQALIREIADISDSNFNKRYSSLDSYFHDRETILSIAFSKPNSHNFWNGLKSDGAYLEGQEYFYLREIISRYGIKSVIEIGAGETSILFKQLGVNALSVEAFDGPWLARAKKHGCNVAQIKFYPDELVFDKEKLEDVISSFSQKVDMVFIDSPQGTQQRSKVLTQILELVSARFVLFHDILRDSKNIFLYQFLHNLRIVEYFDTMRGMALFRVDASEAAPTYKLSSEFRRDTVIDSPDYELALGLFPDRLESEKTYYVKASIRNTSKNIYSSRYDKPVFVAYHWFGEDGKAIIFDGKRTRLPFDIHPECSAEFEIEIITPASPGGYLLEIDLVQEGVCWFKDRNRSLGRMVPSNIV